MEQRREQRFAANQKVSFAVLGEREIHRTGVVKNSSGRGLGLETTFPVAVGSPLRIDLPDAVLLGEAMYCRAQHGQYFVGVELEQALYGLSGLARAFQAFAEESPPLERTDFAGRTRP